MPHCVCPDSFKEVEVLLKSRLDVRSSNFHPIEPVLACGLLSGEIVLLKGSNHSTSISTWKIERQCRCESSALSLKWNVSNSICVDVFPFTQNYYLMQKNIIFDFVDEWD